MAPGSRLQELTAKYMQNPRRYFVPLANEYRKTNELDRAIALCREHLPSQPGHMSGHIVLGRAYFEKGDVEAARETFLTSVELDDENLIALRHLGDIARSRQDLTEARQWYTRVLDADPQNEEIERLLHSLADPAAVTTDIPPPVMPGDIVGVAPAVIVESPPIELSSALDDPTPPGLRAITMPDDPASRATPLVPEPVFGGTSTLNTLDLSTLDDDAPPIIAEAPGILVDDGVGFAFDEIDALVDPNTLPNAGPSLPSAEEADFSAGIVTPSALAPVVPSDDADPLLSRPGFGALASFQSWRTAKDRDTPSHQPTQPTQPTPPTPSLPIAAVPEAGSTELESDLFWDAPAPDASGTAPEFVTETMAALYAKQGFYAQALEVYRALLARTPSDATLSAKISAMERALDASGRDASLEADADKALQFDELEVESDSDAAAPSMLEQMYDVSPPPEGTAALDSAFGGGWSAETDREQPAGEDDWFAEDSALEPPSDATFGGEGIFGINTDAFGQPVIPNTPVDPALEPASVSNRATATLDAVFGVPVITPADQVASEMLLSLAGQMVGRLPKEAPTLPVPDILELPSAVAADEATGASPAPLLSFDRFFSGSGSPPRARVDTPVGRSATPVRPTPPTAIPPSLSPTFGGVPVIPPPPAATVAKDAWATFDQFVPPVNRTPTPIPPAASLAPVFFTPPAAMPVFITPPAATPIAPPVVNPPVILPVTPPASVPPEQPPAAEPVASDPARPAPSEFHRWLEGLS